MLKRIIKNIFLIVIFACTLNCVSAVPANDGQLVRVGISNSNFKEYYFKDISVSATDRFKITDKYSQEIISNFEAGENIKIIMNNNVFSIFQAGSQIASNLLGPIEVSSDNGYITVTNLKRAGKLAYYRGTFEITKAPSKNDFFNVINILDLQSYLRGVVPNEMPVRFGHEALKAQAVLARNYVLKPREKKYHNFDVCDSVACQVYFGANTEKPESDIAINETENIVAINDEELILALYSSTAGGYTENYENAFSTELGNTKIFPGMPLAYLKGTPDNKKTPCLNNEEDARKFYLSEPDTFDNASPYFRWTKEWDVAELEDILKKTLKTQSTTGFVKPKLTNANDFGHLIDIKVLKRGVSGKAMSINIVTDKGTYNVQKELPIRRVFQKNNIGLPSANVIFDFEKSKVPDANGKTQEVLSKVIARGGGFGHGVGMSQWGAGAMAQNGYSFDEIIQHYFKETSIATYPISLSSEIGQDIAIQTFYTKNKKATLVVDNKRQFSKLTVVLNGEELAVEVIPTIFKPERLDLTPYIKKGENKITFILLNPEQYKKPIKVYVEIKEAQNE